MNPELCQRYGIAASAEQVMMDSVTAIQTVRSSANTGRLETYMICLWHMIYRVTLNLAKKKFLPKSISADIHCPVYLIRLQFGSTEDHKSYTHNDFHLA